MLEVSAVSVQLLRCPHAECGVGSREKRVVVDEGAVHECEAECTGSKNGGALLVEPVVVLAIAIVVIAGGVVAVVASFGRSSS